MTEQYNDYPLEQIAQEAGAKVQEGHTIYQKWSCKHCGSRQTMEEPNKLYMSGICEECGKTSAIEACNYLLMMGVKNG